MVKRHKYTRKTTRKFTGLLAEPMVVKFYRRTLVGLTAADAKKKNEEEAERVQKLIQAKLDCLFAYFMITKTGNGAQDYLALSLSLAREWVPGFRVVSAGAAQRGRPSQDPLIFVRLLVDVELAKRFLKQGHSDDSEVSDAKAVATLTTAPRFAKRWGNFKGRERTLANILTKARDVKINPLYAWWLQPGKRGPLGRQALISVFSSLTQNIR
jgi:hypothetical protein